MKKALGAFALTILLLFGVYAVVDSQWPPIYPMYWALGDLRDVTKPTAASDGLALVYTASTKIWAAAAPAPASHEHTILRNLAQIRDTAEGNVDLFGSAASGETPAFTVSGYKIGDSLQTFSLAVGSVANDTATITGLSYYTFDGAVAVGGDVTLENSATIVNASAGDVELTADNTSTSGRNAWQVDYRVSGACTGSSRAGYFHVTNTNVVAITGELTGLEAKVRSTSSNTASAKGIHVSLDAKTKTITLGRGIEVSLDAAAGGGITTAQALRLAHNSSGSHTAITGAIIEGPGTWTKGIDFAGTFDKPIDMSGMTSGSNLWTLFHGTVSSATAVKGIYLEITSTKTSSSTEGIRAEGIGNAASGTATIRGGHFKANILASKKATMLEGVLAHASVAEGGISGITTVKGLGAFVSSGASFSTANLYGVTIHVQTRGDETVSSDYVGLQIQNEAVGGAGKEMDSALQIIDTNVSASGFGYGIDMSGAVIGTDDIVLSNGETIDNTTDGFIGFGTAKLIEIVTVTFTAEYANVSSGNAVTIACDNGQKQKLTLGENTTVTLTPPTSGIGNFLLRVIQDGTGGRIITWPTVYAPDDDSDDDGDLDPDTHADTVCIYNIYYNGTSWYIVLANDFEPLG